MLKAFSYPLSLIIVVSIVFNSSFAQDYSTKAESLLKEAISDQSMVGISAGFSVKGNIIWKSGHGFKDQKKKIPFEANTISRIASVTKTMTAIAVLQLVEKGKLGLDDSFHSFFPDYPKDSKGTFTIRHLLQQSSGVGAYTNNREQENTVNYSSLSGASEIFKNRPLLFSPGSDFGYTSYGYTLLGMVIEKVSGLSFSEYLKKNIWEKADMLSTKMYGEVIDDASLLYHKNSRGKVKRANETNLSDRLPGGGVYSNIEDILKFGNALVGGKLLKKETMEVMLKDSGLKKEGNGYGMGLYIYGPNPKYGMLYGHTGAQTGSSTFMMFFSETEIVIMVMSNTSGALQEVSNIAVKLISIAGESSD